MALIVDCAGVTRNSSLEQGIGTLFIASFKLCFISCGAQLDAAQHPARGGS
jgi:hypothetical protein